MSITKAQAKALADNFLDDIGEGDSLTLQPRETFSELLLLAGEMAEDMQSNLNTSQSNASGKLSESIELTEPELSGSTFKVDILMNYYGAFLNKGVKGTKGGSGLYAFKYDKPSKKMVDAIREYIKNSGKKITNTNVQKTTSLNEKKNGSIAQLDNAYAAARSIVQHGIAPTGFLDKAAETTRNKVAERLGLALKIDIINSLTGEKQ